MAELVVDGFGVYDEWGSLKEVIVGRADNARWPMWDDVYKVASKPVQDQIRANQGGLIMDSWPEFASEYQQQADNLAAVYEENGVVVHRPRDFTQAEIDSDSTPAIYQCSPADCVWLVGRNYIEMQLRPILHRRNYLWARDVFAPMIERTDGAKWLSAPTPQPTDNELTGAGPYVEGGDIILRGNGKDVLVGIDAYSTDQKGFDWLNGALEPDGYKLWPMTFDMIEIHLLAHLNIIGPNLGIICREAFKGHEHLFPPWFDEYDWIDISPEVVHKGGADVVMLRQKKALVSAAQPSVARALEDRGIEAQLVDIERATQASAGVRCMTIVVHREKAE